MKKLWRKWSLFSLSSKAIIIFSITTVLTIVSADSWQPNKLVAYSTAALICSFFIPKDYRS